MSLLRCFIAIEVPHTLQDAIDGATAETRRALGAELVRWVPSRNVHLTLKFLGDTAPSGVELIQTAIRAEANQYTPFDVHVRGFGAFPSSRRPRVLWVGLSAPPVLTSLQHELDVATARLGYRSEERGFSPHLTIGRVRQNISASGMQHIRDVLERTAVGDLGTFGVHAVQLFRSDLQPGGSVYSSLFTAPLSRI